MSAEFSPLALKTVKSAPTMSTDALVFFFFLVKIRVTAPPRAAAFVGAELLLFGFPLQRFPALAAGIALTLCGGTIQPVAPAKALHRIHGKGQFGRYRFVAFPLAAHGDDPFFL